MAPGLPQRTKLWYGLGQAAEGLANESYTLFLLFYYTQVVGLSGALAGQAILIALLFDAVTDPLAGTLSDRLETRWGRRHPFLLASALPAGLGVYVTFAPPAGLSEAGLFAWLAGCAVFSRFWMTFFHVPHLALGAELARGYHERTTIATLQHVFSRGGHAVAGALGLLVFMRPSPAYPNGQLDPEAYGPFAATVAALVTALILLSTVQTRDRIPLLPRAHPEARRRGVLRTMLGDMAESLRHRAFRMLFFGVTMNFVAWGVTTSLGLHLGTYFWQVTTDELFLWGVGAGAGIFTGLAFWHARARLLDKRTVFVRGLWVFTAFTAGPAFLKVAGIWPEPGSALYLPAFIGTTGLAAHFGIAATMVTGRSMMADVTDEDELRHGRRREGVFFGAISFAAKAAFGVGSQVAGLLVDFVGLQPGARPEEVGPAVVRDLGLTLGISVLVLVGLSVGFFLRYDLTRERHAEVRAALESGTLPAEPGGRT